ncbi:MAG: SDR family NAD(P)-dependent oxidoreductase [Nannocystaceae bacterium]|nr:SDR family NAD(P)-dependent oxidoreductase [bacterium]
MTDSSTTPIAIVGLDCLFPAADSPTRYWANLREGVDAITDVPATHWRPEDHYDADPKAPDMVYARRGGFLTPVDFEPLRFGIAPRDLEATDTTQLLALHVAARALEDARLGDFDRERTGVILGVTGALELVIPLGARLSHPLWRRALAEAGVDDAVAQDVIERISEGYVPWQENSFPGLLGNVTAGRIANRLDLHGTNCVVDAACASSLSALHLAMLELQTGRADVMLSGGVDAFNDVFMYTCFSKTPALSPSGDARPFDNDADGTMLGEGVGVVVLKRLADAQRDGDRIYAVLRGMGTSSDGKGQAIYAPASDGQARALRQAYAQAGVQPRSIGLVEAHGTGTKVGDATELRGLASVYGAKDDAQPWCALGSVKSMIGHTKAAAGVAGLIKASLALHHRVLPPTLKVSRPNEALDGAPAFYVSDRKRPWLSSPDHPRRAAVSAFGFGGSNFHCVLEESEGAHTPAWDGDVQLLAFGAASRDGLTTAIKAFSASDWDDLRAQAHASRAAFEPTAQCRVVVPLRRGDDWGATLAQVAQAVSQDSRGRFTTPGGAAFGEGEARGLLAALFPGQGAQSVNMLGDLACFFPEMRSTIERVLTDLPEVRSALYPPSAWTEEARAAQAQAITATQNAQPALGAVSMGALEILRGFDVVFDAAVGHSYGELSALCAAGVLPLDDLGRVSRSRGELMAEGEGDRGSMLAVAASLQDVQGHLREAGLTQVVIANRNSPAQMVCSGTSADIDAAASHLEAAGVRVRRLDVAAAFHSPLVAAAQAPFAESLSFVKFAQPQFPVYANVSAQAYAGSDAQMRSTLAEQIAAPVEFVACIEAMLDEGVDTFVEIGPGRRLSALVEAIAGDRVRTCAVDASSGKRSGLFDLACALGALAAWGHPLDLHAWDPTVPAAADDTKPTLRTPICGANLKPAPTKRPPVAPARPAAAPPTTPRPSAPPVTMSPTTPRAPTVAPSLPALDPADPLAALLALQAQTAQLHQQFLEGQTRALEALGGLVAGSGAAVTAPRMAAAHAPSQPAIAAAPPEPEPARAPAPQPPPAPAPAASPIEADVLAVVSEKTGYPVGMLEPSMGLDADLGIDSIKRVEILSALQERRPDLPVIGPAQLGSLQTLADVIEHLGGGAAEASPRGPAPKPAPSASNVSGAVLAVVSEKTGYPVEMLEPSMGLDADLGIDSIKRVEILSALQERRPDLPVIGPEQLGSLQTLADVIEHLGGSSSTAATPPQAPAAPQRSGVLQALLAVVSEKTGYPVEMLEPSMGLDADLGIDSIKRVEILSALQEQRPELPAVSPDQLGTLQTLADVVQALGGAPTEAHDVAAKAPAAEAATTDAATTLDRYVVRPAAFVPAQTRPLAQGVVWVKGDAQEAASVLREAGLDARALGDADPLPADAAGLVIVPPLQADHAFVKQAFAWTRDARGSLRSGALLAFVTRMGGAFGLSGTKHPLHGAFAGLAKTAAREWDDCIVHSIDVEALGDLGEAAKALGADAVELGVHGGALCTPALDALGAAAPAQPVLEAGDVVLVTGGARGVTAQIARALAAQSPCTLVLLGRSPMPGPAGALEGAHTEAEIRAAILGGPNPPATPAALRDAVWAAKSAAEIRETLAAIEATGARALYRSCDVRDADAVRGVVAEVTAAHGPVRGLVHGAGVLADKVITDKTDADLARVYDTKVRAAEHLLAAIDPAQLRMLVMFSSSTARFGRVGQADYAMANEVLNKLAQRFAAAHPHVRVRSACWGPWDGGMVTPALAKMFAAEGVRTIGLSAGAQTLLDLLGRDTGVEVVVLGEGSALPGAVLYSEPPAAGSGRGETVFARTVGVEDHPFLASHAIGGKAVLPAAMMLEWFAHAATAAHPGLRFVGLEGLEVYRGVKLGRADTVALRIEASPAERSGSQFRVPMSLCSGGDNGHAVVHARTTVVLASETPASRDNATRGELPAYGEPVDRVYATRLFHGSAFQGITSIDGLAAPGINATVRGAPRPKEWMQAPVRGRWITEPLAIDCGLQAVIVWSATQAGSPSLPSKLGAYRQFRPFPAEGTKLGVRIAERSGARVVADLDWFDRSGTPLAQLTGAEFTLDPGLAQAFTRNRVE